MSRKMKQEAEGQTTSRTMKQRGAGHTMSAKMKRETEGQIMSRQIKQRGAGQTMSGKMKRGSRAHNVNSKSSKQAQDKP